MIYELYILKSFVFGKEYYERYYQLISSLHFEDGVKQLFILINKYYKDYPIHTYISKDELVAYFHLNYPTNKHTDECLSLIERLYTLETSDSLAETYIRKLLEKHYASEIIAKLLDVTSGERSGVLDTLPELILSYQEATGLLAKDESPFVETGLDELIAQTTSDGIQWRLEALRQALGPLPGGTLGHVFARPESGKTTFCHSEASFFASQLKGDECLIWLNNEEAAARIKLRFYSAVCGASTDAIVANKARAVDRFNELGGHRVKFYDSAVITVDDVASLCRRYQPRLVIIDQGDKVTTRKDASAGNGAERLKLVYDSLREVVKTANAVSKCDMLTIGQADAQAEGVKWLTMGNLDGGKTGKAGAFDYIIGIGKSNDQAESCLRFISACKNKLKGDHGRYTVSIDDAKARYAG